MRRDVLTRFDGIAKRDAPNWRAGNRPDPKPAPDVTVRSAPNDHDEPTWDVRQPNSARSGMRRIDRRTRSILTLATVAAIVVNAGAAWAYWKVRSETVSVRSGTVVEMTLYGRSDLDKPLTPGGTGSLTVTLANDNDFPIQITSVSPGSGNIVADDEHRDAGCLRTDVTMTRHAFDVSWDVAKNTIGAFTVPAGLRMAAGANRACDDATFTVPVRVRGVSGQP